MKSGRKTTPQKPPQVLPGISGKPATVPTPRTDAMLEENGIRCACSDKPVSLCRQLEQELSVAVHEYLRATEEISEWKEASGLEVCGGLEKLEPRHLHDFLHGSSVEKIRGGTTSCRQGRRRPDPRR